MEHNPTEAEILILQALWDQPDATVHEIHERVLQHREVGYTTILKQLQRMLSDKGMVTRRKQGKQHLYRAAYSREMVEGSLLNQLSNTIFGGSSIRLALRALGEDQPSTEELDELQSWLNQQKNKRS